MKRSFHLSAAQMAALCGLGGLISASGFLSELPAHAAKAHHPHASFWPWAVAVFALVLLGLALTLSAYSRLQNGIAAARWSDEEIERLRILLSSGLFTALSIAFLLGFVILALPILAKPSHLYTSIGWASLMLVQPLTWLRMATHQQASNTNRQPTWSNIAPLSSEYWGGL